MIWNPDLCWKKGELEWNSLSWSEPWCSSWFDHHLIQQKTENRGQLLFCDTFNRPSIDLSNLQKEVKTDNLVPWAGTFILRDLGQGTYSSWALPSPFIKWIALNCPLNPKFYYLKDNTVFSPGRSRECPGLPPGLQLLAGPLGSGTQQARQRLVSKMPFTP